MNRLSNHELGQQFRSALSSVAVAVALVFTAGQIFGQWLYELNDDVTALLTGNIFLCQADYIRKLRSRGLSLRVIASQVGTTQYQVRKALGRP
jgi:hypothetical protein